VTVTGAVTVFESSEHGRRYSCRACGAPVYSHYDIPDEIDLYAGSFDEPGLWQPSYELWTKRREPWLPEFTSVVRRYAARSAGVETNRALSQSRQLTLPAWRPMVRP
jgi:hypothetical protein